MSRKSGHSMKSKKAAKVMDTEQPEALDIPGLDSEDPEKRILILKREKIKIKTSFTKLRNKLLKLLDDEQDDYELPSRTMVREYMECMVKAQETALMVMDRLSQEYNLKEDDNALKGITQEMELIDNELVGANKKAEEELVKCQSELDKTINEELGIQPHKNIKFESSEDKYEPDQVVQHQEEPQNEEPHQSSTGTNLLGRDMWRQLEKVTIPIFSGNKAEYEGWKAAFTSCVDNAPATPQYKLLQMKKYLGGEALISVKKLGHSASAYATAKERLERKYGGKRRRIALIKEELDQIKPLRDNQAKDMEMFADALDVCVANLIDVDKSDELGNGTFYSTMLVKLTDAMLTDYQRWLDDKNKEPNVQSLREWVIREADFLTVTQETKRGVSEPSSRTMYAKRQDDDNKPDGRFNKVIDCPICNNEHLIWYCDTFKSMDIEDRWNAVTKHRLCFSCLGKYHTSRSCRKNMKCGINGCQDSHNRLLHKEEVADSANTSRVEQEEVSQRSHTTVTHCSLSNAMALRTVPVILKHGAKRLKVNALLDDGSTQTYVNADVAAQLGLHGTMQRVQIGVLNGKVESLETMSVRMGLESLDGSVDVEIDAYTTDRVTGDLRVVDWKTQASCWKHLWSIPFPSVGKRPIIDILIGIDYADLHFSFQDVRGGQGEPIARKTPLGWTCVSAPGNNVVCTNFARTYFIKAANPENDVLDAYLKKFWELEEIPRLDKTLNSQEQKIMQEATDSLSFVDEHYQVRIPWRTETNELPNNYDQALNRLQSTEKKLLKSPDVATAYNDVIESYIEKGYISKVDVEAEEENNKHWYLPHFAVVKPEKETTKVRIVFDAAAKYKGISLNDIIHQGPKLQQDLQSVLNRFRMNPIALVCDIAEMYLRIEIAPTDRPYHRFLWRNLETDRSPDVYQFNRVVFGVNCSPFLAQFVTQHHARVNQSTFPMASSTVLKSTYMDDSMDSVNSETEAIELYKELMQLWGSAGMIARKWLSNSTVVMEEIPSEARASRVDVDSESLPSVKTLGVLWIAESDEFQFHVNQNPEIHLTKRSLLRVVAQLFDPVGFLCPFTVRGKMILQEVWLSGSDWDDPLFNEPEKKARRWLTELQDLHNVKVPRCLRLGVEYVVKYESHHIFVDASQEAYGACIYARYVYEDGTVSVRLVSSKTRVAPITTISIPRLELMAAVLGLKLAEHYLGSLEKKVAEATFWSDSMNVLWWLRGYGRQYKPFVANRIGEIQRITSPNQWRYVPTRENVADLLTRGMSAHDLAISEFWWEGPHFLKEDETQWPQTKIEKTELSQTEMKKTTEVKNEIDRTYVMMNSFRCWPLKAIDPSKYSSWMKCLRVQGWVWRFCDNLRLPKTERTSGELNIEELSQAEWQIIRVAQAEIFKSEYEALAVGKSVPKNSKLLALNPKLEDNGLMRCDGRLIYSEMLPYDVRFPIILPRKAAVTMLIVKHFHEKGNHAAGTNQTLCAISAKYWIVCGREAVREWENECYECRRRKAKPMKQMMAPLPDIRLGLPVKAFACTAVDFAGPFITMQGRGKRREKRYLCLFTCVHTRAVHLEVAYGLDTDSFLNAFFRMVNRRGPVEKMVSDNGSNFIGAHRELKELYELLDQERIKKVGANNGVEWHFNPPLAPHFGGIHESMIKSAKRAIYAIVKDADVTDEELYTVFTGAEALINSRPLTYQSASPQDNTPLTPNHFLHGQVGGKFAPETVDTTDFSLRKRWRRVQEITRHFWRRWMQEWLPSLNARKKWFFPEREVQEGDIVLVVSQETVRGHWPLARITEVFPGKDGHVRVVKLMCAGTEMKRSITKICPLELNANTQD